MKVGDLVVYTLSSEVGIIISFLNRPSWIPGRKPVNPRVEILVHTGECINCYINRLKLIA